ncbi:hypothetical protein PAPYR_10125 [Paratrimastix pyriformis]|uniref:Uncharacterized protein n=1 Tax=Paratrimastix pyriformis TaxID=342808 RepID=A0ABQ8UC95_9EUKA|nr:hypothetical protein PAPYR_10125 [Paratrimastix pyriformis]
MVDPTQWPPELLRVLMGPEGTPGSLRLYISLLGLSHAMRQAVRGTLRHISFDGDIDPEVDGELDRLPTPTADSLAALVGPCKGLVRLSLAALWGCGRTEGGYGPWVDEAFSGHAQLAVLHIPRGDAVMAALPRILGHLPGLVDFLLEASVFCTIPAAILDAVVRYCPRLEALHLQGHRSELDLTPLVQSPHFCSQFTKLTIFCPIRKAAILPPSLTNLTQLHLSRDLPGLAHIAAHLTHLTLDNDQLPDIGPARLETLVLSGQVSVSCPDLSRLLAANRATLRSLVVHSCGGPVKSLFHAIGTCPMLTYLDLITRTGAGDVDLADLPPPLLSNQLQSLRLGMQAGLHQNPIRIASNTLRLLDLGGIVLPADIPMTLDCPLLEDLALPACPPELTVLPLVMCCPRLLRIAGLGDLVLTDSQAIAGSSRLPQPGTQLLQQRTVKHQRTQGAGGIQTAQGRAGEDQVVTPKLKARQSGQCAQGIGQPGPGRTTAGRGDGRDDHCAQVGSVLGQAGEQGGSLQDGAFVDVKSAQRWGGGWAAKGEPGQGRQ